MRLLIPPPVQGLIFAAIMWGAARAVPQLSADFAGQLYLAAGFAIAGGVIEAVSAIAFFRAKTTVNPLKPANATRLVTGGLYQYSRNPMYLGLLLLLIGWAIWLGNLAAAPLPVLFIAAITWAQIMPEEAALREKFGDEYEAYCSRVRRWI